MPKLESLIEVEEAVARRMTTALAKDMRALKDEVLDLLDDGNHADALAVARAFDPSDALERVGGALDMLALTAVIVGASRVVEVEDTSFSSGDVPDLVFTAREGMVNSVLRGMDLVVDAVVAVVEADRDALDDVVFKGVDHHGRPVQVVLKAAALSLADRLNAAVDGTGAAVIDYGANLTTSRLISYGFMSEAVANGYDEYQVTEVLDERTCPVCRYMHGQVFSVSAGLSRMEDVLRTTDPDALKAMAPFPGQSKEALKDLFGMDAAALRARGWDAPPYHPRCRGTLVQVGEAGELPATPTAPITAPSTPSPGAGYRVLDGTQDSYDELGSRPSFAQADDLSEVQVEALREYQSAAGYRMNRMLRGAEPMTPEVADTIALVDEVASKSATPEGLTLWRGVNGLAAFGVDTVPELKGRVFRDRGFFSTSTSKGTATEFTFGGSDAKVLLQIRVPSGTRAVHMGAIPQSALSKEMEVVLGRGQKFRVVEVGAPETLSDLPGLSGSAKGVVTVVVEVVE